MCDSAEEAGCAVTEKGKYTVCPCNDDKLKNTGNDFLGVSW